MLRGPDGRDHGLAVGFHLAMLGQNVRPSASVEHHAPPVGIERLGESGHVHVLMPCGVPHVVVVPSAPSEGRRLGMNGRARRPCVSELEQTSRYEASPWPRRKSSADCRFVQVRETEAIEARETLVGPERLGGLEVRGRETAPPRG